MAIKKLSEVAEIILGYPFESEKFNTEGNGVCLVRGMNVTERALRFGEDARFWDDLSSAIEPYYLKENDILIGMDGSKVGKNFAIVRKEQLPLLLVQRVACIRAKDGIYQPYLWFSIANQRFSDYINTVKTGSSIPHISGTQIGNYPIEIPDYLTQKKLADVLWDVENKIDNNNAICADLECMAKLLYDYWFVQFDFPDENGKPYKSSGGKMVWNEELKREIPAGWTVAKLEQLCDYVSEKGPGEFVCGKYISTDNMLPNMQGIEISDNIPATASMAVDFKQTDILVSNIRPYFQKIWLASFNGKASTDVLILRAKQGTAPEYLYHALARSSFFDYVMQGAKGSKMPRGDKEHIMRYQIAVPPQSLIQKALPLFGNSLKQKAATQEENIDLASLRDFLLPMLMNGQVKVKETIA